MDESVILITILKILKIPGDNLDLGDALGFTAPAEIEMNRGARREPIRPGGLRIAVGVSVAGSPSRNRDGSRRRRPMHARLAPPPPYALCRIAPSYRKQPPR